MNVDYKDGRTEREIVEEGTLHERLREIFRNARDVREVHIQPIQEPGKGNLAELMKHLGSSKREEVEG